MEVAVLLQLFFLYGQHGLSRIRPCIGIAAVPEGGKIGTAQRVMQIGNFRDRQPGVVVNQMVPPMGQLARS